MNLNEKFKEIIMPSNYKFGWFFSFVFTAIGTYFLLNGSSYMSVSCFGVAGVLCIVTVVKAELLLPLNKAWMALGLLIAMVVSPIVLGVIFFGLFTPIALVMRLSGRDELRLKVKSRSSYWKIKGSVNPSTQCFENQF